MSGRRPSLPGLLGIVGAVLTVALAGCTGGSSPSIGSASPSAAAGVGEIFLEPKDSTGPDPFTASVASPITPVQVPRPTASASLIASALPSLEPTASLGSPSPVQAVAGGAVGLYGGSLNNAECDVEQLIAFLEASADKARAWASVHGIDPSEVRTYIERLTPVTLLGDTRVTNHGFRNGTADARQSVMQGGTAVLVDAVGVPRARCFCGNPLAEPVPVAVAPSYRGQPWAGFSPASLTAIAPAPSPLPAIPVIDASTGAVFSRPSGTDGGQDAASAPPGPTAEPTPSIGATAEPTQPGPGEGQPVDRPPAVPSDLTGFGAVGANSIDEVYGPLQGAVDVDLTTSWFSKGPHTPVTVTRYEWAVSAPIEIGAVILVGNGANATPDFRTGFGFAEVTIEILRDGEPVGGATQSLAGSPDPRILVDMLPGTMGDTVRLSFTGHESLDCGGIGELLILGPDWRADADALAELGYGG